jgi:hypothetical protein
MYSTYMFTYMYRTGLNLVPVSCAELRLEITTCWHIVFGITESTVEGRTVRHARTLGTMLRVREVPFSVLIRSGESYCDILAQYLHHRPLPFSYTPVNKHNT